MHLKRLRYALAVMMMITSVVVLVTISTGNTLAMIIDKTMSLVNTFVPTKVTADTEIDINIDKIIVAPGVNSLNAGGFTFELTDLQTNDVLAITSNSDGEAALTLSFDEKDIGKTYSYTLKERNDAREGFTYSTKVYQIQLTISLIDNDLVVAAVVDGQPVEAIECEFVNIFHTEDGTLPPPPAGDGAQPALYFALIMFSAAVMLLFWNKQKKTN